MFYCPAFCPQIFLFLFLMLPNLKAFIGVPMTAVLGDQTFIACSSFGQKYMSFCKAYEEVEMNIQCWGIIIFHDENGLRMRVMAEKTAQQKVHITH